jgi:hypothetical protein
MTSDKNYKFIRSLGNHEPQQEGFKNSIYNFDEELDGYTSPGGTVRMTKGVANVAFIALAAEAPNTLLLKVRQEAYEPKDSRRPTMNSSAGSPMNMRTT